MSSVVHYLHTFSQLSETFVYDLIVRLQARSLESHEVLCHCRTNEASRPCRGVTTLAASRNLLSRALRRTFGSRWGMPRARDVGRFLDTHQPQVVHAHFGSSGVRLVRFLEEHKRQVPVLIHCHGTDVISLPHTDAEYRATFVQAADRPHTAFAANTQFLREKIVDLGVAESNIHVIPYGLNEQFSKLPRRPSQSQSQGPLRVIAVGRVTRWKGHHVLLDAVQEVVTRRPGCVSLTIVGDGEEQGRLVRQVEERCLSECVVFKGAVAHSELPSIMAEHDVLVQPSIIHPGTRQCESFGMTALEAIAVGLPVIVTQSGGLPELVGRECEWARIVPQNDPSALAAALTTMLDDYPEGTNEAYASERLDAYTAKRQLSAVIAAYESLVG